MKDTTQNIKPVCVIVYKEDNTIEGVIETEKDFKKWLSEHNKTRKIVGAIKENADEFKVIKTILFTY